MDGWMDGQRGGRMDGMGLVIIGHRSSKGTFGANKWQIYNVAL